MLNNKIDYTLAIYITTRNRPSLVGRAIQSAINNSSKAVVVIVSDNSTDELTQDLIKNKYPQVGYVKRFGLTAFEHFQVILNESVSDFITILHDDDELKSGYVESTLPRLIEDSTICAAAPRAQLYDHKRNMIIYPKWHIKEDKILAAPLEMIKKYMVFNNSRNPPFSGYMYRKSSYDNIEFDKREAGKYSDFTFLLKLLEKSKILWIEEANVIVGLHEANDSNIESIPDYLRLCNHISKRYGVERHGYLISAFKLHTYTRFLILRFRNNKFTKREFIICKFIISNCHLGFLLVLNKIFNL